ncbi:MAG TPA: hypothetical protein VFL63_07070 [Rhodanobacteraceae bacterium]|nr:hypothetical protein [Rhodanobacteraceae bacterium]
MPTDTAATSLFPLMLGLPDDGRARININPRTRQVLYSIPGNARIGTDLAPAHKSRLVQTLFGEGLPILLPPVLHGQPMINAIGDPDTSAHTLRMLQQYIEETDTACFNHPAAVLATDRAGVADKLAGIEGLIVPRTLRLRIDEPAGLAAAAEQAGLGWPLIVRLAGAHRGESTVLAHKPEDVRAALRQLPWGGHDLYLTEYVDCRDADGLYRKLRLVVVGGEVCMRHQVIAHDWMVHVGDRRPAYLEEEQRLLDDFETTLKPAIAARVRAAAEALDMDYFGIDCSLRPDGRLLVFEANVLMDILINTMPLPNCWEAPIARIREALTALLFEPARWRHPPHKAAPA